MSNNTSGSERNTPLLVLDLLTTFHVPLLQHDRSNQLPTNSLLAGKFTGNCKNPFIGCPRRRHYRATATDIRHCKMALPLNLKFDGYLLRLKAHQLGELALDAVDKRRDRFSFCALLARDRGQRYIALPYRQPL